MFALCLIPVYRFTGSVKLKGIIIIGGEEDTHPSVMKLYVMFIFSISVYCLFLCLVGIRLFDLVCIVQV